MQDVFSTLPKMLKDVEGSEALREAFVFAVWKRIAGEALSAQTSPLELRGTRLKVAVSDKTWQRHLQDLSSQMLFKLNAAAGTRTVEFIEFVIDANTVTQNRCRSTALQNEAPVPDDLKAAAGSIVDEGLRREFLAAAGNCLARMERLAGN